jgi:hypothetical protein
MGGAAAVFGIVGPLSIDISASYKRMTAGDGEAEEHLLELFPISFIPELALRTEPVDAFVGLGPSIVGFKERFPPNEKGIGAMVGGKLSLEARFGMRVDTQIIEPSLSGSQFVQSVHLELFGARRLRLPGGKGFDLSAWRAGLGVLAAF